MEFNNGTYRILYVKQYDIYVPIGCLTSNNFSETVEMIDTTVRTNSNGWKSSRPVGQSYNISFSGLIPEDITSGDMVTYNALRLLKRDRTLIEWKVSDGTINEDYGEAYITSLSNTANIDGFGSFDGSLVGYGEPLNLFDKTFKDYKTRVEADGGALEAEQCAKTFIQNLN